MRLALGAWRGPQGWGVGGAAWGLRFGGTCSGLLLRERVHSAGGTARLSAMVIVRYVLAALLLPSLALVVGCGRAPEPAAGLFDGLERGRFEDRRGPDKAVAVEFELSSEAWLGADGVPVDRVAADGESTIFARVPLPASSRAGARSLRVALRLSGSGGQQGVRVVAGALQFASSTRGAVPDLAQALSRSFSGALAVPEATGSVREFMVTLLPAAAELVLFLRLESDAGAGAAWASVREAVGEPLDAYSWVEEDLVTPCLAQRTSGWRERLGLALPEGRAARWPARLPEDARWLDLAVGVLHPPRGSQRGLADETVRFRLEFRPAGGGAVALFESAEARAGDPLRPAGWSEHRVEVPVALRGRAGELSLLAESDLPGSPRLPVAQLRCSAPRDASTPPNVLLISLDTLRADRLGLYGHDRATSPHLDALGAESTVFERAWSTGAYTLPSHASLFSGQYPSVHRVERPEQRPIPELSPYMAELFKAAGYATGAFTGGGFVMPTFGFARGFDVYGITDPALDADWDRTLPALADGLDVAPDYLSGRGFRGVSEFLERRKDEPFFLFVHTYAAHELSPPDRFLDAIGAAPNSYELHDEYWDDFLYARPLSDEQLEWARDRYDAGVLQADELVGRLLEKLDELDLAESTIVVVTSDHGKELGERGRVFHSHQLRPELVRVPLILHVPGQGAERRMDPASLVDLLPTLAGLTGVPAPAFVQGRDLFGGELGPRSIFAELDRQYTWRALLTGERAELAWFEPGKGRWRSAEFDLESDPGQLRPLPSDPEITGAYRQRLIDLGLGRLRELGLTPASEGDDGLLGRERAMLQALGYEVGDSGSDDEAEARD